MRPKKEAGQALVLTAAALVVLLGFVGLGVDMGAARYERRLQQTAADAAAIAGATNLTYGGVQSGAQNASAANGFTDNTGGGACAGPPANQGVGQVTVTVCNGPSTGPHAGNVNYVEAFVTSGQPTYFMKIFGVNSETITARAVATNYSGATNGTNNYNCLTTLGPPSSSIEGVNINGNATLNAPTCGIADNGNYNTKGNALNVNAGSFGVSGSANVSGPGGKVTCTSGQSNCPQYGTPAVPNPLASLAPPCSPCTGGTALSINSSYTVTSGTYSSISITGNGTVTFSPGTYIINGAGGFSCSGTPTITGTGVFFYFTGQATYNCQGNDTANLTAPSSGTYQGILLYQDPMDCNCGTGGCDNGVVSCGPGPAIGGNTGTTYNGVLYFPNDQITFFGNGTAYSAGIVIADSFGLSGHPTVNLQGQAGLPGSVLPPAFTSGGAILVE
jgi:hypothetical protein